MANFLAGLNLTCSAAGPIPPSSFVCLDATQPDIFQARLATATTDVIIAISQVGTDVPPNLINALTSGTVNPTQYAAVPGEPVTTFDMGDVAPLQLGASGCLPNALLTADPSGHGMVAGSGNFVGAIALQGGNAGDIIYVLSVSPGTKA